MIAEKFQAMVTLGRANRRLKDFYDIWVLSRSYDFEGARLARAMAATRATQDSSSDGTSRRIDEHVRARSGQAPAMGGFSA